MADLGRRRATYKTKFRAASAGRDAKYDDIHGRRNAYAQAKRGRSGSATIAVPAPAPAEFEFRQVPPLAPGTDPVLPRFQVETFRRRSHLLVKTTKGKGHTAYQAICMSLGLDGAMLSGMLHRRGTSIKAIDPSVDVLAAPSALLPLPCPFDFQLNPFTLNVVISCTEDHVFKGYMRVDRKLAQAPFGAVVFEAFVGSSSGRSPFPDSNPVVAIETTFADALHPALTVEEASNFVQLIDDAIYVQLKHGMPFPARPDENFVMVRRVSPPTFADGTME
jgi:hypothetical protein